MLATPLLFWGSSLVYLFIQNKYCIIFCIIGWMNLKHAKSMITSWKIAGVQSPIWFTAISNVLIYSELSYHNHRMICLMLLFSAGAVSTAQGQMSNRGLRDDGRLHFIVILYCDPSKLRLVQYTSDYNTQ